MMRFAEDRDIYSIKKLWYDVFCEEPDFNGYFFENVFDVSKTLIAEENGRLLSMVQLLPYEIKGVGSVTYIYGAATASEYRGRGLMRELLEKSFDEDVKRGAAASVLIPAEPSLFDYYAKIGYETTFFAEKSIYIPTGKTDEIKKADLGDISKLSAIYSGDVVRTEDYWIRQLDMYNRLGGSVYIYGSAYAVVSDRVEEVMSKNRRDRDVLLDSLCSLYNWEKTEITQPGGDVPVGMMRKHRDFAHGKMYMNLMYN